MEDATLTKAEVTATQSTSSIWSMDKETYPFFDREMFAILDVETVEILIEDKIATGG